MQLAAPWRDRTLQLLTQGYDFVPRLRRAHGGGDGALADVVDTALMLQRVTCIGGPDAAALFYDESRFRRHGAMPRRIQRTLVGVDAVQTLDGRAHAVRKAMFMSLMDVASIDALRDDVARRWSARWARHAGTPVSVFDLGAEVLAEAAFGWAGVPLEPGEVEAAARDLTAMVDAFGAVGPRHWRGRRARTRMEDRIEQHVAAARAGRATPPAGSAFAVVVCHRDADGRPLPDRLAAVELLNVVRPITAIAWYAAFAARQLHLQPQWRPRIATSSDDLVAFVQEVRRHSPFTPFVGACVRREFEWLGHHFAEGQLVLLDVYGDDHDPRRWESPEEFRPERFRHWCPGPFDFIPQGGGDVDTGHRCAGERLTIDVLATIARRLAMSTYGVPEQDLGVPLGRMPSRVRTGMVVVPDRAD